MISLNSWFFMEGMKKKMTLKYSKYVSYLQTTAALSSSLLTNYRIPISRNHLHHLNIFSPVIKTKKKMSHVYLKGNFISPNVRLSSWLMRRQHKEIVSHVPPQMHSIISLFFCGYKYSFHFISEKFWHHAVTWPIGRFGESAVNLHQLLRYHRKCQKSENGNCETGG